MSLPAWGEWIEIAISITFFAYVYCLSPHGESGLKYSTVADYYNGVGGSLPAWGEWIEIKKVLTYRKMWYVSPRMGRVD